MKGFKYPILSLAALVLVGAMLVGPGRISAQSPLPAGGSLVQAAPAQTAVIPISSTAAVNNQVTLTIPAPPPGMYNYVCYLHYGAHQDGTATVQTNAVTTSTNFNSFAVKYSLTATATINYDKDFAFGAPATGGCAKSTSPGTATTFVGPAAAANLAQEWHATYYQGF